MLKLNKRGVIAHFLLFLLLGLGLVVGVYLVSSGNPLKLFSKASVSPPIGPETSFSLAGAGGCNAGILCLLYGQPAPEEEFAVKLYVRSDIETANLFTAKMTFPKELVEVKEIKTDGTFIQNWVENFYDNNIGEISLAGGVPSPGYQTQMSQDSGLMVTIVLRAKALGKGTVAFTDSSAVYSNLNNINILTIKRGYDFSVEVKPSPSPTLAPGSTVEIGLEAGEQHDSSRVGLVAESGAAWVRLNFVGTDWSAGSADVNVYNSIINDYLKHNIKIIGVIGAQSVNGGYNRNDPGSFTQKYVNTADAIVASFGDRVKTYELFNEPNDWAGGNTAQVPEQYFAEYLGKIYRQIKIFRARGDINLNSGPLFSHDLDTGADYLTNTYRAGRQLTDPLANWEQIKRQTGSYPLDSVGYHIYIAQGMGDQGQVEYKIRENLDAVEKVIVSEDPGKKVWITEFGWGTGSGRATEDVQAQNLEKAFRVFKADSMVKMAMWFTLMDFDIAEWGLVRGDGRKKLSWGAFQKITGLPVSSPTPTPAPPSGTKGDGNKDGKINLIDMSVIHTDWMKTENKPNFHEGIDMNSDGLINAFDFAFHRSLLLQLGVIKNR